MGDHPALFGHDQVEHGPRDQILGAVPIFADRAADEGDAALGVQAKNDIGDGLHDGVELFFAAFDPVHGAQRLSAGGLLAQEIFVEHERQPVGQQGRGGQQR